jgi:hypothetical protein
MNMKQLHLGFSEHESEDLIHFNMGRIMTPEELDVATADVSENSSAEWIGHWALCGDIAEEMFNYVLKNPNEIPSYRLTAIVGNGGGRYFVLTTQVGMYQHRFLVPLYEPSCLQFVKSLCHQPLVLMLGRNGESDVLVLFPEFQTNELWNVVKRFPTVERNERFLHESMMAAVAREVSFLDRIQPLDGVQPAKWLSLTVVMTPEFPAEMYEVWTEVLGMNPAIEDEETVFH